MEGLKNVKTLTPDERETDKVHNLRAVNSKLQRIDNSLLFIKWYIIVTTVISLIFILFFAPI